MILPISRTISTARADNGARKLSLRNLRSLRLASGTDQIYMREEARLLARRQAAERTQRRLTDVEVDVAVRFHPLRMASAAIARLSVGDVVALEHRTTAPLAVTSAATTFAHAVPGTSGRKLAVLIVPSP